MKPTLATHNENPRAAIVAKYAGPTNSRGSRIIVKSQRSRRSYSYEYGLSGSAVYCHAVAQYLAEILAQDQKEHGPGAKGWGTLADYSIGATPSGEYVFVSNT
jgi:hypothetical protein